MTYNDLETARSEFRRGRLLVGVKSPPIHCIPAQLKKPRIAITAFWGLHILKAKCQRREGKHYFWKSMHFVTKMHEIRPIPVYFC